MSDFAETQICDTCSRLSFELLPAIATPARERTRRDPRTFARTLEQYSPRSFRRATKNLLSPEATRALAETLIDHKGEHDGDRDPMRIRESRQLLSSLSTLCGYDAETISREKSAE